MLNRRTRQTLPLLPVLLIIATSILLSCEEAVEHTAPAVLERDSLPMMRSYGVNTLISDSGVIRYRIVAERWDVNIARNPSLWEFMKGVFFEQFDEKFHVEGYIQADTAWYYDKLKLWKLRGRVRIRNMQGLVYTSEELYWDGMRHEFYSNVFSRVVTPERTMEGTYFRSDEHMTHYTVNNSKGSFVPDTGKEEETQQPATAGTPADTVQVPALPQRPAATKRAKTERSMPL
ncbi:MAG: LPS export ABC transporter periplasmic protein LptC [Prevotella sp.]|nr:LPS export ABC transporter periplasmic protein LptC [Prevotella sp.]